MDIVYFVGDEWEGLYLNGTLRMEAHSLCVSSVLSSLYREKGEIRSLNTVTERGTWLVSDGQLPDTVEELLAKNKK